MLPHLNSRQATAIDTHHLPCTFRLFWDEVCWANTCRVKTENTETLLKQPTNQHESHALWHGLQEHIAFSFWYFNCFQGDWSVERSFFGLRQPNKLFSAGCSHLAWTQSLTGYPQVTTSDYFQRRWIKSRKSQRFCGQVRFRQEEHVQDGIHSCMCVAFLE